MPRLLQLAVLLVVFSFACRSWADATSVGESKSTEKPTDGVAKKSADASADDNSADPAAGHSLHGEAFDDGPRQHAYLMPGTGKVDFPASTKNEQVRAFINQGVGQLHGFWYFEAERSFREAAMIEPDCAIAYWGMAMANLNNDKRAKGFIAEAVKRKNKASEHERKYIDALDAYWKADPKKKPERNAAYVNALEELLYEFPDDLDAQAWIAMTQWQATREGSKIDSYLAVDALLGAIFAKEPMHPAHHYRIHLWDDKRASKALESSALCGPAAAGIAHMWHMPGHIYSRLKRYRDAAWQQEASARVDHAYMIRDRVMPDQIHNFAHNNEWLIRDLINIGAWKKALGLAENMISLPRHPKFNSQQHHGSYYFGRQRLLEVLEKFELWEQTVALANTPYFKATDDDERIVRLRALGRAYFHHGDRKKSNEQLTALRQTLATQQRDQHDAEEAAEAKIQAEATEERAKTAEKTDIKQDKSPPKSSSKSGTATAVSCDSANSQNQQRPAASKVESEHQPSETSASQAATPSNSELEQANGKDAEKQPAANDKATPQESDALKRRIDTARKDAAKTFDGRIANLQQAIAELEGLEKLAEGKPEDALKLLETAKVDPLVLARVQLDAGKRSDAEKTARSEVGNRTSEVLPLAAKIEVLWKCGKRGDAYDTFEELRRLSSTIDLDCPVFARLSPIAKEFGFTEDWRLPREMPAELGERPALDALGPEHWQPYVAPQWALNDAENQQHGQKQYEGKPVLVIFYLGYGCIHCAEQLQAFAPMTGDFADAGISIIAISTDNRDGLTKSLAQCDDGKFPFPLVSDSELGVFKDFRVYDDFEKLPLHGTFLIDAHGLVRWQDISYEPFKDVKFVLEESNRLLALPATTSR
ncbi:MAG: redoxin domain-containing protein [Pirellulales bacterium]|nr:redoxin domain-containing protein [Pirellulales bacterium]